MKLSSIVMTAMLLGGGLVDQPCLACSCAGGWNFAGSAAPDGTAVFAGRVTSLDYTKDEVRNSLSVTLQVSRIWKGSRAPIHVVRTSPMGVADSLLRRGRNTSCLLSPVKPEK